MFMPAISGPSITLQRLRIDFVSRTASVHVAIDVLK